MRNGILIFLIAAGLPGYGCRGNKGKELQPNSAPGKLPTKDPEGEMNLAAEREKAMLAVRPAERELMDALRKRPDRVEARSGEWTVLPRPENSENVLSPDGHLLALSCIDPNRADLHFSLIKVIDLATGKEIHEFNKHKKILGLAFSSDGGLLASGYWTHGSVEIWDLKAGKHQRTIPTDASIVLRRGLTFSPDGKHLGVSLKSGKLRMFDVATGEEKLYFGNVNASSPTFSPNGALLAAVTGVQNEKVTLWEVASGGVIQELAAGTTDAIAFTPDSWSLVVAVHGTTAFSRKVLLWDLMGNTTKPMGESEAALMSLAISPNGKRLAYAGKEVVIVDLATGQQVQRFARSTCIPFYFPGGLLLRLDDIASSWSFFYATGD